MGRGRSKVGGGGGGKAVALKTPSGVTYDEFMKQDEQTRFQIIQNIIDDPNIKAPDYLDPSDTTKVIYALGMNAKPKVVDDATLDGMQGREIFRTVYEKGVMPPPTTEAVVDQIRHGDYTQMSNSGGSLYGRAIYFATNFNDSASYGSGERNAMIMRGKLDVNAKFPTETTLRQQMRAKNFTASKTRSVDSDDGIALYAISQGLPGWHDGSYTMIVNRSVITMSSKNKRISKSSARQAYSSHDAYSWSEAGDAN